MTDEPEIEKADPDQPCGHDQLRAAVVFAKGLDPQGKMIRRAEVRAWCEQCDEPVRWSLESAGMHPTMATVEGPERQELRVPCHFTDGPSIAEQAAGPRLWVPGMPGGPQ